MDARCKGVEWFPSCTLTFAPFCIKRFIILVFPRDEAMCKGVLRFPSGALTSAPCSMRCTRTLWFHERDARCRSVETRVVLILCLNIGPVLDQ